MWTLARSKGGATRGQGVELCVTGVESMGLEAEHFRKHCTWKAKSAVNATFITGVYLLHALTTLLSQASARICKTKQKSFNISFQKWQCIFIKKEHGGTVSSTTQQRFFFITRLWVPIRLTKSTGVLWPRWTKNSFIWYRQMRFLLCTSDLHIPHE